MSKKEDSLYLTIKQEYFDQIVAGTKKEEYREIKPTTYKKYVECDEDGNAYYNADLIDDEGLQIVIDPMDLLFIYNEGKCVLLPKEDLKYLNLAVGYNKVRDTAKVEIKGVSFEPMSDPKTNRPIRFDFDQEGNQYRDDKKGRFCFWIAVFHLGKIVEKNIVNN